MKCNTVGCKNQATYLVHNRMKNIKPEKADYGVCDCCATDAVKKSAVDGKPFGFQNIPIFTAKRIG